MSNNPSFKVTLANMWTPGLHATHHLLVFLINQPDHSAAASRLDVHLRQVGQTSGAHRETQELVQMAYFAGLLTSNTERPTLTKEGIAYAAQLTPGSLERCVISPMHQRLLVNVWSRRNGANRLYRNMERVLRILLQLEAHKRWVPIPYDHVEAVREALMNTLHYLHEFGITVQRDDKVCITNEGLQRAVTVGCADPSLLDDEVPEGLGAPEPELGNLASGKPEPNEPEPEEPEPEEPEPEEPQPEELQPDEPELDEPVLPEVDQPHQQKLGEQTSDDEMLALLTDRLKPMLLAHMELKGQVSTLFGQLDNLLSTVESVSNMRDTVEQVLKAVEQRNRLDQERTDQWQGALDQLREELVALSSRQDGLEQSLFQTSAALEERLNTPPESPMNTALVATLEQLVTKLSTPVRSAPEPAEIPLILPQPTAHCRPVPSERVLLDDVVRRINKSGYRMDLKEVANLWTCVKSGRLTVLAGPPGSGKSSAVRTFANALGHRPTLADITVRRGWTDDQQFMGAVNRLYQRYEPAPTGVVPHLLAANLDREVGLYWILLDEFNLSTPEYYFAELISVLESDDPRVTLYTPGVVVKNADLYPPVIPVAPNLHFFATVNLDDTASPLSPRLVDRANVIWMERQIGPEMLVSRALAESTVGPISAKELLSKFTRPPEFVGPTRHWWDQLQQIMDDRKTEYGAPHFISPRSLVGLARYVANAPQGVFEHREAFDFGLAQRVLPGIRGFGNGYGKRLGRLQEWAVREKFACSSALLDRIIKNGAERGHEYDFLSCLW